MQSKLLFAFALITGLFSYAILFFGFISELKTDNVVIVSLLFFLSLLLFVLRQISFRRIVYIFKNGGLFPYIFIMFASVNLVGALGPESGFDAVWYHLVLPKIFIEKEKIEFIKGGLLYYSVMPKNIDLLYIPALMFGNEVFAKLIHFSFGVLTAIVTYITARLFVSRKLSFLAALIFYSNLVVGWMSITAYIDLGRAFFGSLAIYYFLIYSKTKERKHLFSSAILVGLESTSKLLGFSTLFSLLAVTTFKRIIRLKSLGVEYLILLFPSLFLLLPWIIFSLVSTGNVFYPFFTEIYPSGISLAHFNPLLIIHSIFSILMFSQDPISPLYLMIVPLVFVFYRKMPNQARILLLIIMINLVILTFVPHKNTRFLLPYLPSMSVLVVLLLSFSKKSVKKILYIFIIMVLSINFVYRLTANSRYIPYLLGFQSKEDYLVKHLNFQFGDYYDLGGNVRRIVGEEEVLIVGIHNLYYIDFNYVHESWADNMEFKYILTNEPLVKTGYNLVYKNLVNSTYLYEINR